MAKQAKDGELMQCTQYGYAFACDIKFCRAAAHDAGNQNMRKSCRTAWNDDDWNRSCDVLDKLLENATACCAKGEFMWPINDTLRAA